jgi:hypothetical protein
MIATLPAAAWCLMYLYSSNPNLFHPGSGSARKLIPRAHDELHVPLFDRLSQRADAETWSGMGFRDDGMKLRAGREHDLDFAKLNSKTSLIPESTANLPIRRNGWQTEDSLKLPLTESLFLLGQVGANAQSFEWQQYKLSQAIGFGFRLPVGGEVQLRSGKSVMNYDPDDFSLIPEKTKSFVELTTKWRLPWSLNLQYSGEASRAQTSTRDILNQDLRLAVPLSNSGQVHVGAKYRWEETTVQTPWIERTKLYFGLEWKR